MLGRLKDKLHFLLAAFVQAEKFEISKQAATVVIAMLHIMAHGGLGVTSPDIQKPINQFLLAQNSQPSVSKAELNVDLITVKALNALDRLVEVPEDVPMQYNAHYHSARVI
jgi:hypothetical protein